MKKYAFMVCALFVSWTVFCQTQADMNNIAAKEYELADKELNLVYTQIRAKYAQQPLLLSKLRDAQLLWIRFRDASVDALYPDGPVASMYVMLRYGFLERLTRDRIEQLRDCYLKETYYP